MQQAHEAGTVHAAQPPVETQQHERIEAAALEQAHALAQVGEAGRRFGWCEELSRQRLEGQQQRGTPRRRSLRARRIDQRPVPEMQTVEAADRHDATAVLRREVADTAHEIHQRPSPARRCAGRIPETHSTAA